MHFQMHLKDNQDIRCNTIVNFMCCSCSCTPLWTQA